MAGTETQWPENLDRIVRRFKRRTNPKQRYQQLLSYAKRLEGLPEECKTADNKVPGCVSQVYITADLDQGRVCYQGDSDAQIVKGLVGLLIEGLNGLTPEEIGRLSPDFIEETGLQVSLTPSRANGFYNIFQTMKKKALACQVADPA
ncbi:MAG: cysteine desulfuration protein SufE [Cyanobacteria bacterium QS_8_64_29]|nr:MAG: cysteine desulfuration protein SufE [Cyanobacteria bacterium QS_8_64_29]